VVYRQNKCCYFTPRCLRTIIFCDKRSVNRECVARPLAMSRSCGNRCSGNGLHTFYGNHADAVSMFHEKYILLTFAKSPSKCSNIVGELSGLHVSWLRSFLLNVSFLKGICYSDTQQKIMKTEEQTKSINRTRRNGIAPCAARHKLLLIGRLLQWARKVARLLQALRHKCNVINATLNKCTDHWGH
jgi:hypothetical protein